MSKAETSPAPKAEPKKLPEGARITRHGSIVQNGNEPVRDDQ